MIKLYYFQTIEKEERSYLLFRSYLASKIIYICMMKSNKAHMIKLRYLFHKILGKKLKVICSIEATLYINLYLYDEK